MSGFDVLFDQDVSLTSLQEAIATVMDIELGRVAIIGDIEQYPKRETADCVCWVFRTKGQFPIHASIDYDEGDWPSVIKFARSLARSLQCNCLIGDDSPSSYLMIHISHLGTVKPVLLDMNALDAPTLSH